jgi:hypothetical protein
VNRRSDVDVVARQVASITQVKQAERGLLWALVRDPTAGFGVLEELDSADLDGLATGPILEQARSLQGLPAESLPKTLIERLNEGEAGLVQEIGRQTHPPADPLDCVRALKRLRYVRERTEVQREIDRLQEQGATRHADEIVALWDRKKALVERIEALMDGVAPGSG